jgi:AcrR family transcriptional regulator
MSGEERKRRIANAAMRVFSKKGFRGAKTREIAKAAGVSEAMVFKCFKNKNDIYTSIISGTVKDHSKEIDDMQSQVNDLPMILKEMVSHVIDLNEKDPTFLRLMLYSSLEEHKFAQSFVKTHLLGQREAFAKVIERGVRSGEYRKVDPKLAARIFEHMIGGYCVERFVLGLNKGEFSDKGKTVEMMVDMFLNGLRKHGQT